MYVSAVCVKIQSQEDTGVIRATKRDKKSSKLYSIIFAGIHLDESKREREVCFCARTPN